VQERNLSARKMQTASDHFQALFGMVEITHSAWHSKFGTSSDGYIT
jgi:hypothetical protein